MADLVYQFGRTVLEGMFRENLLGLPLWRYDHPGFPEVRGWSQELNGSARCSGDALIAPTAAQTDGPTLPPERPRRESNPRPPKLVSTVRSTN
eukprot:scaffold4304_cov58-Phaeocystis_antarctica.AAC.11